MGELTPQDFVSRWRGTRLKERSASQSHFIELCGVLGVPTPTEADRSGTSYAFERGAEKIGGKQGFADVWKRGCFAWEYKGPHANLEKALDQLRQYQGSLETPPLLIVSDLENIEVHTNFNNSVSRKVTFTLDDLLVPARLDRLRRAWTEPFSFRSEETPEQVTAKAAAEFARLAEKLRERGESADGAAHFLIRTLFCLFAEDVGLLPGNLFTKLVAATRRRPEAFTAQLKQLFGAMRGGGYFGFDEIRHFDGGLFEDDEALPLDEECMSILHRASGLDWGSIEPAILGTLFERSLDPGKRAQLGAHYTSRDDILRIVEPVLMAPLRREWEALREKARNSKNVRRTERDIASFAAKLRSQRVLDPACGSGNFLYVALKELLDLEKEVREFAGEIGLPEFIPEVGPEQLRGIEINEYVRELATVTVQIGYIQWLRDNGFGTPPEPILKPLDTVRLMDAIMTRENGAVTEPEWPESDVIVGNPPFLGGSKMRRELRDDYVTDLWKLYESRVPGGADLVCYWFEKARRQIEDGKAKRAGLLATQAIRGGANRRVLSRIKQTGDIFFAEGDRPWILDGAAVHVSMIGFDSGKEANRTLDSTPVAAIYANLTGDLDLSMAQPLPENKNICFRSDEKGGPFDIGAELAHEMLNAPANPNNRLNSDVVRPYVNGMDVTRRSRNGWIVDFGVDATEEDAALYELPFEYAQRVVKPVRDKVRNSRERKYWWLHRRPAPDMRSAVADLERFVVTPRVAKHRLFVWMEGTTIPDCQLHTFARDDDYFFGLLHSRAHELWARRTGTQLREAESGFRYTPTTCFETFPFPVPDEEQRSEVSAATKRLDELRRNWLDPEGASEAELKKRTLTNLYNARPTWLANAHDQLDRAVYAAYGWPPDISGEDILENLLALNLKRSGGAR